MWPRICAVVAIWISLEVSATSVGKTAVVSVEEAIDMGFLIEKTIESDGSAIYSIIAPEYDRSGCEAIGVTQATMNPEGEQVSILYVDFKSSTRSVMHHVAVPKSYVSYLSFAYLCEGGSIRYEISDEMLGSPAT